MVHMRWHSRVLVSTSVCWLLRLLEFHQELLVVFDLVIDVLLAFGVLLATER